MVTSAATAHEKIRKVPDIRFRLDVTDLRTNVPTDRPVGIIRNGPGKPTVVVYRTTEGGFLLDCNDGYKRLQFTVGAKGGWMECFPFRGSTKRDIEEWVAMLTAEPGELFISFRHDELCGSRHRVFRFDLATKNKIARLLFRKGGHNPLRPRRPNRVLG